MAFHLIRISNQHLSRNNDSKLICDGACEIAFKSWIILHLS